ncbi:hypothetical protein U1769_16850 [Sphingomonas sp. ZT3P38]|uniref:hypothetical protein n=1 Tax=Parasphingomonas zepuensis TaxID=3096161 RepID=UPI002FCA658E
MQHSVALGVGVTPGRLGQRALLLSLLLGAGALQLSDNLTPSATETADAVRALLTQSGFRTETSRRSWANDQIKGLSFLVGRHPLCREPITIKLAHIYDRFSLGGDGRPIYIYDDWQGAPPSRFGVLMRAFRLEARSILSFGRLPKPPRTILAIRDPSACLALTAPNWRTLWE